MREVVLQYNYVLPTLVIKGAPRHWAQQDASMHLAATQARALHSDTRSSLRHAFSTQACASAILSRVPHEAGSF